MEEQKLVRKRDIWFYMFVLGTWVVIGVALFYAFTVYNNLEELRTNPCLVCERDIGMSCSYLDYKVYSPTPLDDSIKKMQELDLGGVK